MNFISFLRVQWRFLLFGYLMMGLSNFGQTFFIALYSADIRAAFDLSVSQFGGLYSATTLVSALVILISGKLIDQWPLQRFVAFTLAGCALGCLVMGFAGGVVSLAIAFFLLRHFAQGLCVHTGVTAISRAYDAQRGRAVSIVQLGYASAEGVFPTMVLVAVGLLGWQQSWLAFGLVILLFALPLQIRMAGFEPKQSLPTYSTADEVPAAGRAEVLRDPRFYLILPLYTAAPFLLTGMFFHQVLLAEAYAWPLAALAGAFGLYAGVKIFISLGMGVLIDRFTALRLMPISAVPLALAFVSLLLPSDIFGELAPFIYLGLIGANVGTAVPLSGSLWPELFGVKNLGAIRSLNMSFTIFATAAAPVVFGLVIDGGVSFYSIAAACLAYTMICGLLAFIGARIKLTV